MVTLSLSGFVLQLLKSHVAFGLSSCLHPNSEKSAICFGKVPSSEFRVPTDEQENIILVMFWSIEFAEIKS